MHRTRVRSMGSMGVAVLCSVAGVAGLVGGPMAAPSGAAAAANAPAFGTVYGRFFPNPTDSGPFTVTPSTPVSFTQQFPVILFNPPADANVHCAPPPAPPVDTGTRPMVDVIPQPDGGCATEVAAGEGYQAGVGPLFRFQAVFTSTVTVAAAGDATFGLLADDGWTLALGPDTAGHQPTYVGGSRYNAPATGPFTGYPVVGAYNDHEDVTRHTLTVHFPAAGTYPFEMDYTERNGGNLALTFELTVPPEVQATAVAQVRATATTAARATATTRALTTATTVARLDATATTQAHDTATTQAHDTATTAARSTARAGATAVAVAQGEATATAGHDMTATAAALTRSQATALSRAGGPNGGAGTPTAQPGLVVRRMPASPRARGRTRPAFPLRLAVAAASVLDGGTVSVHVQTLPRARLQGALSLTARRIVRVGQGARRHWTTRIVQLYALPLHGQASARGLFTTLLRIAYQPSRPTVGRLSVTARSDRRVASAATALTIRPLPLIIGVSPHSVRSGARLTVTVRTVPRTTLRVVVQVAPARRGRRVYQVTLTGVADRHGRFTRTVRLTYRPARPTPMRIVVTVRSGAATVTGAATATLRRA